MFEPSSKPRVFGLAAGADFPAELINGLVARLEGQPPEALARVQLIVNTRRMARRLREIFDAGPPRLLPRISLITDLGLQNGLGQIPPPVPALRRRLELVQLVSELLDQQPDLAAQDSAFDLADSLAALMDEMQGEGVGAEAIRSLDVADMSGHWSRAQAFIGIVDRFLSRTEAQPDLQGRQRLVAETLLETWKTNPPQVPVIIAGSTGSRGTTLLLMRAIARLPQGAIVLPGFDFDVPASVWTHLNDPLQSEDHPQFRFRKLATELGIEPTKITPWTGAVTPAADRGKVISLALRPAPVTDAWLTEGPALPELDAAMRDVTLVEAPSQRAEALAIALRLRQAAEDGEKAALITPDRTLTRQVTAALDRWNILPDDSAGTPLQLSPPGRFLRHVADLFARRLTGETLLTVLKHPLCHSGPGRNEHLLAVRDLELYLRRNGPPYPDTASLTRYGQTGKPAPPVDWTEWLTAGFGEQVVSGELPLTDWVIRWRYLAERLAAGCHSEGSGGLWDRQAGQKALEIATDLEQNACHGGSMLARDFANLIGALLAQEEVRDRDAPHPRIMIWGTLEARVQGADLLILAGLNEGSWPETTQPDPWLNRQLRLRAGLLLPERRIGLSAHDFQQAVCAPKVWLTRAVRSEDATTVPSRWINRITNLLDGLPDSGGRQALINMRSRGLTWLRWAKDLEKAECQPPEPRPAPRPPLAARPRQLSVTEIKRLIRDPYAVYAKHVLRLKPLDPLVQAPDALQRGIVVHKIFEEFIRHTLATPKSANRTDLIALAQRILEDQVPWPTARRLWIARIERVADWFLANEIERRKLASPVALEASAKAVIEDLGFALTGKADRIDRAPDGSLYLYDYKTGAPPSQPEQEKFDKQLLLEAAMAEQGAFMDLSAAPVVGATFIGLGANPKEVSAPLEKSPPQETWAGLCNLIKAYLDPQQGYTSRRMVQKDTDTGDYDQLARFGEWDRTTDPTPMDVR